MCLIKIFKNMKTISEFNKFLLGLTGQMGIKVKEEDLLQSHKDEYSLAAAILNEINKFFYQTNSKLDKDYISEFHKYWSKNAEKVLEPKINDKNCLKVAEVLEEIYKSNSIKVQLDTLDLKPEEIANVRFFTAIQDFKIDINANINPFELYKSHPESFNPQKILDNELLIDQFLNKIGADSQRDKRKSWMNRSAKLLVEKFNGSAYNINEAMGRDVLKIKDLLAGYVGYGFSQKKVDMFLRDMIDLNVWTYKKNVDKINVMSDKNTMRIALRTGILEFRIPLLASYLDVYCYQYGLVDEWNTEAWRRVWINWEKIKNNHRPPTPASFDYFIFKMGKLACWKAPQRRKCEPNKHATKKWLETKPVQDRLIFGDDNYCLFNKICNPDRKNIKSSNVNFTTWTNWMAKWKSQ
jgi:hypothetical protein